MGQSIISDSRFIYGDIESSIIFPDVYIGSKASVKNSIIMPGAYVGHSAYVENAIIGPGAVIESGCAVLGGAEGSIAVVGQNAVASDLKTKFGRYITNSVWSMNPAIQQA